MNILVFSWRDPKHPLAGGAEQVMHEHMKGWVKAGNKVTFLSSSIKGLPKSEEIDGVKIVRKGYQYLGVQIAGFFYYLTNREKFDFLVDEFHGVPFFTPLYSKKPKLAVIQEPAREVWFKNLLIFPLNYIIGLLGFVFEPLFFLFYKKTKFMTGSKSAKANVIRYGIPSKNIEVVSHGVLLPKNIKSYVSNSKTNTITFLGTLSKDKGIEDALKTFSILSKNKKLKFWVMGKADKKSYFDRLRRNNKVKFWGRVGEAKKFELLSKSLVLINPSVHEGWGLVNIEANSVGTPVVAYNSAGLVDSVNNGISGVIVKKNTPKMLAKEIQRIITDKIIYQKLQKGAVSWSKTFNWENSKKKSQDLIVEICK